MEGTEVKRVKIVFLDAYTTNPGDIAFEELAALGDFTCFDRVSVDDLPTEATNAEVIITNKFKIDTDSLALFPLLKYVVVAATGYNNIDIAALQRQGITASNVRGYSTDSVVQHVFSGIFHYFNRIDHYNQQVKTGRWSKQADFCFFDHSIEELADKTIGIIGLGTIGSRVAVVANALGMNVIAYSHSNNNRGLDFVTLVTLDTLFVKADIISLHCPLNDSTKEIINKSTLAIMKNTALLINTGRGGLIDERALFYALDHGVIAAAALDVLTDEPPHITNPLINHVRCIITPHIAWASKQARQRLVTGLAVNIQSYIDGNPINLIT